MSNNQRNESPAYAADTEVSTSPRSLSPIPRRYNQNNGIDDITLFLQSHTFEHNQSTPQNISDDVDDDNHNADDTESLPSTIQPTLALTSTSEAASPVYSPDTSIDILPFDRDVSVHFGMNDVVDDDDDDDDDDVERGRHYGAELDFYDDENNGTRSPGNENGRKIYDFYDYDNDTDYTVDSDSGESQPGSQQRFFHFNHELKERLKQCHEEQQRKEAEERRTCERDRDIDTFAQRKRTNSLVYNTSNYNSHTIVPPKPDAKPPMPSAQLLPLQTTRVTQGASTTPEIKVPIVTTRIVPQNSPPKYTPPPPPPPPSRQTSEQPSMPPQNMSPTMKQSPSPNSTSPRDSPPSPTASQPKRQDSTFTSDSYREKVLVPPVKSRPQTPNASYIPGYDKDDEYAIEGSQNIASSVPLFPGPNQKLFAKSPILMCGKNQQQQQQHPEEHVAVTTKERSTSVTSSQRPALYDQKHVWAKAVYGHLDLTPQKSFSRTSPNQSTSPAPAAIQQATQPPLSPKFTGPLGVPQQQQHSSAASTVGPVSQPQGVPPPTGYTSMPQSQSPKGLPTFRPALSASPSYHMRSTSTTSQPQRVPWLPEHHARSTSVSPTQQMPPPSTSPKLVGPSQPQRVPQQRASRSTGTSPSQRQWALRLTSTVSMGPVIVTPPSSQAAKQVGTSPKLTDLAAGPHQPHQPQPSPSLVSPKLPRPVAAAPSQPQRVPQGAPHSGGSASTSPTQPLASSPTRLLGSRAGSPSSLDSPSQVILPAAAGSLTWQRRHLQPSSPNLQALALEQGQPQNTPQNTQSDPVLKMIHGSAGQQFTTIVAKPPARAGTFRPELSVKPCRFFGVHLQNLSREQLTRKFVPNIVERSLEYLEVAIINRVEGGKATYALKGVYPRIGAWTAKDTQRWLETELELGGLGQAAAVAEAARLTGKRLLALTEREAAELFGDGATAERVMTGIELTDTLQRRGDSIIRGANMDANAINELFGLVDMWNSSVNQVVDYFRLKSSPAVVCALLKQYLRDLPVPLVPLQLFLAVQQQPPSQQAQMAANSAGTAGGKRKPSSKDFSWDKLLQLKQSFNTVAWETVNCLVQFLSRIASDEKSLVPVSIIADAFGPAVFKPQGEAEEKLARKALRELVRTYSGKAGKSEDAFNRSTTPREFMYGEIIVSGESNVRCYFGPSVPCTLQSAEYAEFANARHWINGVIYFTNYRIVWEPNFSAIDRDKNIAYTFAREIPIASVASLSVVREPADRQDQGAEMFAGKVATRDLGVYYFQFATAQTLTRFTEEVARSREIAPFAWANKELDYLPLAKRKELGWNIYRPEKRLGQFIGEDKGFFLQDTLKLYSVSASDDVYPRNCVVSSLILPNFMTLIRGHRLVPVLTWVSEQSTTDRLRGVFRTVVYRSKNSKYKSCLFKKQALKDEEAKEEREREREREREEEEEEKRRQQEQEQQLEQLNKEEVLSSKPSRLSIIYKARRKSLSRNALDKIKLFEEGTHASLSASPTSSIARRKEREEEKEEKEKDKENVDTTNWAMFYKAYEIRMVLVMDSTGSSKPGFLERQGSVTLEVPGFTAVSRRFTRLCNMFLNYQGTEEWARAEREAVGQWTSMIHDILFSTVMVSNMISSGKNSILLQPASNEEEDMISALSSLAAVMADGRARTIEGFVELIEREWIDFGFPHAKAHGDDVADITVNAAVLIVFLDCVWQLWTCFPESFEFNEALLLFIAESVHSGRFGTFYTNLCCASCAAQLRSKAAIPSLWAYVLTHREAFANPLCTQAALTTPFTQRFSNEFVAPNLWAPFYMRWRTPANEERYARQLRKAKRADTAAGEQQQQQLDFANLGLATFPQGPVPYARLAHIRDLNLSRNGISSLPSSVYLCGALAQLDISHNSLRAPFSVEAVRALSKHVPELAVLDVSYNGMECLPANFAELGSIRKLCIGGNSFKEVPRQIFELRRLRSLSLESGVTQASLAAIPFSRLDALEELSLSRCGLTDVPAAELASMKALRILNLSYNELTNVDNFPCIMSLKILDLSYNRIASLPLSLSNLVNLVDLNVRHNCLTELTPAIGQLRQLSRLVIDENNLKSLPPTLSKLPFLGIGEFIHDAGLFPSDCNTTQKKLANLQSLLTRKVKSNKTNVFILGNPAVGKTVFLQCLVKKYKRHAENMHTISTDGVDITPWHFDWKDESGEVRSVNAKIWDFAGQVIYTSTHHFFLTSRGVYVLVWKLPLGDAQCRLAHWLNLISITTKSATVYIVGTHTDSAELSSGRVEKMLTDARARYTRMYPQLKLYFRAVSNLTKEGLKRVREELKETICASLAAEEPVPYQYLMLENQAARGRRVPPVLTRKEWEAAARCCDIGTEAELARATEFLHATGSLVCFQRNAALRNYVILDPQWLADTLATVITHKHNWVRNGILRRADLVHIWKAPEFPPAVYPLILDLLEAFNIMFWLPAKNVPHILDAAHSPEPSSSVSTSTSAASPSGSSNSTPPPLPRLSSPTTIPVPSPSPTSSLSASPSGYGLSPAARIAHQREQSPAARWVSAGAGVGEAQDESVIFLPALLPEAAPDYSKVWRRRHMADEEEIGRRFSFQCLPESLFSKLLVIFSHTYNFSAVWRDGAVMEVRDDEEQQRPSEVRSVVLIRQSLEANTLDVHVRYSTVAGGNEIVYAGELFQSILEVIGRTIRDWYRVNVAAFVVCSSCLERGLDSPFLCRHDRVEAAIAEGLAAIRCPEEGADVPLTKMAPEMVIGRISAENSDHVVPFADLTLLNVVGEGAAASVYKAQYRGETVAVKMFKLEREGLGMFADQAPAYDLSVKIAECRREMAVMSRCRMPNVLRLVGFVTRPLCLVIEYADGGSLYSYIHDASKPLEWPLRLKFALEVASAVQKLHSSYPAIIHRDLKSPNVLLKYPNDGEKEGTPKAILCDFGLSGKWEPQSQSKELAVENPIWTAPEVLRREDCTTKSDVYSLGVILWELLTRECFMSNLRFMGEIADAVIAGTRPQIPEVPEKYRAYATLIEKCWDPEPIKRPAACNIVAILSSMIKTPETN